MLNEREIESCYLGQFIPVHYHHNMLMDQNRMHSFKNAIHYSVFPGAKVLELGGGTGVLSFFAAQNASKVYCVEFNPDMVTEARRFLAMNPNGHKVEVIESFKRRYLARFGGPLPLFMPEAVIMAAQPLQQEYDFDGFHAPIVQFQETGVVQPGTVELAQPAVYSILDFSQPVDSLIAWEGSFLVEQGGTLNAMRFVTKNVLAIVQEQATTIDWLNHYMTLPLYRPLEVKAGDLLRVAFAYRAGGSIPSLQASIQCEVVAQQGEAAQAPATQEAATFA